MLFRSDAKFHTNITHTNLQQVVVASSAASLADARALAHRASPSPTSKHEQTRPVLPVRKFRLRAPALKTVYLIRRLHLRDPPPDCLALVFCNLSPFNRFSFYYFFTFLLLIILLRNIYIYL